MVRRPSRDHIFNVRRSVPRVEIDETAFIGNSYGLPTDWEYRYTGTEAGRCYQVLRRLTDPVFAALAEHLVAIQSARGCSGPPFHDDAKQCK